MIRFTATISSTGVLDSNAIPSGFAFATLGPNSLIDRVMVGNVELGPRTIVDLVGKPKLSLVRPLYKPQAGEQQIVNSLELELWEACETPVVTPRNPVSRTIRSENTGGAWINLIRLPVAGRRAASLHITGEPAKTLTFRVFGVKYGTGARDHWFQLLSSSGATAAEAITGAAHLLATVYLYGGLDAHEDYDELQLWQEAVSECDASMEAYDL